MNTDKMKQAKPRYQFYTDKVTALTAEIAELKRHNTTFVLAELAVFVAMITCLVAYTLTSIGVLFIVLAVISFAVYYFIRQVDAGKNYKADECERLLKVYENELSYLNGDFMSNYQKCEKIDVKKRFSIKKFGRFNKKHYLCTH